MKICMSEMMWCPWFALKRFNEENKCWQLLSLGDRDGGFIVLFSALSCIFEIFQNKNKKIKVATVQTVKWF